MLNIIEINTWVIYITYTSEPLTLSIFDVELTLPQNVDCYNLEIFVRFQKNIEFRT